MLGPTLPPYAAPPGNFNPHRHAPAYNGPRDRTRPDYDRGLPPLPPGLPPRPGFMPAPDHRGPPPDRMYIDGPDMGSGGLNYG